MATKKSIYFALGMFFLFLSVIWITGTFFGYKLQLGKDFYGFSKSGFETYSWCQPNIDPYKNYLLPEESNLIGSGDNSDIIMINTNRFNISLSNQVEKTNSMNPTIYGGSRLILMELKNPINYDYSLGEIVCFWNNGYYERDPKHIQICHRILDISENQIKTMGDNNLYDDGWIEKKDVSSIVIGVLY